MWNSEADSAFHALKQVMLQAPILSTPNFHIPFVVEANTSGRGLGAVLSQNSHSIAYFSKALGVQGQANHIYEKELMAIVLAVQKWRHYLLGRHFIIWSDQHSLRFITEQRDIGNEYQRWISKLMGYDFEIKYKPGTTNQAADAFSRHPSFSHLELDALLTQCSIPWEEVQRQIAADPFLHTLHTNLSHMWAITPVIHSIKASYCTKNE